MNGGLFFALWVAEGFGAGRIPFAPGTFGSLVGVLWFLMLLALGNFWLYLGAMTAGFALSVWLCGLAERILCRTDPPSIVLDEIVAVPVCFATWVGGYWFQEGTMPPAEFFFSSRVWPWTLGVFLFFRFFDVVKPWPVRQSQLLPRGWGVTVDDLLAAVYVNILTLLLYRYAR